MSKETLKLTIESLVRLALDEVLPQIEEALAQQEQGEPVAHCVVRPLQGDESFPKTEIIWAKGKPVAGPLYTTPQPKQEQGEHLSMQVRPSEFAELIKGKEAVTGIPAYWAEWPNKEKP